MKIAAIIDHLESLAPPSLQESYDNTGLITGNSSWNCTGILCCLDSTEKIVEEAIARNCNLIVAHHPIIFGGLKKITGKNYVERTVIAAIKNDIAIYAIHTNLDNIIDGVNGRIADKIGLINRSVLAPKASTLKKLHIFVPISHTNAVRDALFAAGGGHIGNYSECSFSVEGTGSFKGEHGTDPFVGKKGERHYEPENRLEMIFPDYLESRLLGALKSAHPYEEVAYDIVALDNQYASIGSGLIGELSDAMEPKIFLAHLKDQFGLSVVKHTAVPDRPVKRVAVCGGAGSFLISKSLQASADVFVTADMKYHEFFDADGRMMICDLGHYESEQFTIDLLAEILREKFPTFAVLKSDNNTNPVYYYF